MSQIPWQVVLPILHLIWSSASPALKAAALTELKTLDAANSNVVLKAIIEEAEVLVAAA